MPLWLFNTIVVAACLIVIFSAVAGVISYAAARRARKRHKKTLAEVAQYITAMMEKEREKHGSCERASYETPREPWYIELGPDGHD